MIRMTNLQKYKRVLFSRYGLLAITLLFLAPYVVSLFPEVRSGDKFLGWMTIGVFLAPVVVFIYGIAQFDARDLRHREEENPKLKQGESLIDFLYEDEVEKK